MRTSTTPTPRPVVQTMIFILLLLGLLAGTGYAWKALTRSALAHAKKPLAETIAKARPAPGAYASAPLPPSPGQAKFHPSTNLSNTGSQASKLSDVAYGANKVYVAWHEMGTASEVRFRASTNSGASFVNEPSGQVLATIPSGETLFSIAVAASNTAVHVIYSSGASEATAQVSYRSSIDDGATFSSPVVLAGGPGGSPFPDIATDSAGNVQVVFEDRGGTNDIHHRLSTDGGTTFGIAVNISNSADESIRPRIAANGANVGVVWQENDTTAGPPQGEVRFAHSTDNGMSFPPSTNLSNSAGTDSTSPDIGYGNSIHVVWAEGTTVAHRSSGDGGASFAPVSVVDAAAAGDSIRGPRISANGMIVGVVWMIVDSSNVVHGPFLRRSDDDGATLAAEQNLADGIGGVAFDPPAIVAAPGLRIVWPQTATGEAEGAEILFLREISCSVYWVNPVSGSFTTAANWNTGVVPAATDDVCIQVDGTYTVTLTGVRTINSLVVGDSGNAGEQTLHIGAITGAATILTVSGGALNLSSGIINLENLTSTNQSSLIVTSGALTNNGAINVNPGSGGPRAINANLINNGAVNINVNTSFNKTNGVFTNNSALNIAATRTLTMQVGNQTFNQNGGTIDVAGS
ncbi:MAG TPA: hypothetical protein VFZ40_16570, partial [Pyrinomonadaceae bacterium]